jgi:hypothetical protein
MKETSEIPREELLLSLAELTALLRQAATRSEFANSNGQTTSSG